MLRVTFSAINQAVNGNRKKKAISRIAALTLAAYLLTLIAPTMADEMTPPAGAPADAIAPLDSSSPTPEIGATPSPSGSEFSPPVPSGIDPAPLDSASPSPSPTKPPPFALENQSMSIRVPAVLKADPRARSLFLPQMSVQNSGTLLVCISSASASLDVNSKNVNDSAVFDKETLTGDLTNSVRFVGSAAFVMSILNGDGGLRAFSTSRPVSGQNIFFRFVSLSEPSVNPELCNDGSVSNTRTVQISELGIDLDMKKGDVTLKR